MESQGTPTPSAPNLAQAPATPPAGYAMVQIAVPPRGETATVPAVPGTEYQLDVAEVSFAKEGNNLVAQASDGGKVVFEDYFTFASSELPPAVALAEGGVVPQQQILADVGNPDLNAAEPAAGGPGAGAAGVPGGGAAFTPYAPGSIGSGLGTLDLLGNLDLAFGAPTVPDANVLDLVDGSFAISVISTFGEEGAVAGLFEDNLPRAGASPASAVLNIVFTPGDADESVVSTSVSGFPAGYVLQLSDGSAPIVITGPDMVVTIPGGLETGIQIIGTPENADTDFTLAVSMTVQDTTTGVQTAVLTGTSLVVVDAVADIPTISVGGESGFSDTALDDGDNSHTVVVREDHAELQPNGNGYYGLGDASAVNALLANGGSVSGIDLQSIFSAGVYHDAKDGSASRSFYSIGFVAQSNDATDGSEELTEVRVEISGLANAADAVQFGSNTLEDGEVIQVDAVLSDGSTQSVNVLVSLTSGEGGITLILTPVAEDGASPLSADNAIQVERLDLSALRVVEPQHAADSFSVTVAVTSAETNPTDAELDLTNNTITNTTTFNVDVQAVADAATCLDLSCVRSGYVDGTNGLAPALAFSGNHGEDTVVIREGTSITPTFTAQFSDNDGSEQHYIVVEVPKGWTASFSEGSGWQTITDGDTTYVSKLVSGALVSASGLTFRPDNTDTDVDTRINYYAVSYDVDPDGDTAVPLAVVGNAVNVVVDAVADPTHVDVTASQHVIADGASVTLTVAATFGDFTDGSEKHYILIEQKAGWSYSHGDAPLNGTTVWVGGEKYLSVQVDGLIGEDGKLTLEVTATAPSSVRDSTTVTFDVLATAVETTTHDGEFWPFDNYASDHDAVQVVVDPADVGNCAISGGGQAYEDGQSSSFVNINGLHGYSVAITLGDDSGRSEYGAHEVLDSYTVTSMSGAAGDLYYKAAGGDFVKLTDGVSVPGTAQLYFVPSQSNSDVDVTIKISAQISDPDSHDTDTISGSVVVKVDAVADAPQIVLSQAQNTYFEDANLNAPIDDKLVVKAGFVANATDRDGSEELTKIQVTLSGLDDKAHTGLTWNGNALSNGQTITGVSATVTDANGNAVAATVSLKVEVSSDHGNPVYTFTPVGAGASSVQVLSVDLSAIGVQLPSDSSDDFSVNVSVTSQETAVHPSEYTQSNNSATTTTSFSVVVDAVADKPTDTTAGVATSHSAIETIVGTSASGTVASWAAMGVHVSALIVDIDTHQGVTDIDELSGSTLVLKGAENGQGDNGTPYTYPAGLGVDSGAGQGNGSEIDSRGTGSNGEALKLSFDAQSTSVTLHLSFLFGGNNAQYEENPKEVAYAYGYDAEGRLVASGSVSGQEDGTADLQLTSSTGATIATIYLVAQNDTYSDFTLNGITTGAITSVVETSQVTLTASAVFDDVVDGSEKHYLLVEVPSNCLSTGISVSGGDGHNAFSVIVVQNGAIVSNTGTVTLSSDFNYSALPNGTYVIAQVDDALTADGQRASIGVTFTAKNVGGEGDVATAHTYGMAVEQAGVAAGTETTVANNVAVSAAGSVVVTVVDTTPSIGAPISLALSDADISGHTPDTASGGIAVTAAKDAVNSVRLSADGIDVDGIKGDIVWKLSADGKTLSGYADANANGWADSNDPAITIKLDGAASVAAGQTATYTVTATLNDALLHQNGSDLVTIGGVGVIATDADGDAVRSEVTLTVADDKPTVGLAVTTASVNEGGTVNGTWSVDTGNDTPAQIKVTIGNESHEMVKGETESFVAGTFTLYANGTWKLVPSNVSSDTRYTIGISATDADNDTASQTANFTVTDTLPTVSGSPLVLDVAEAGLTSTADTGEHDSGTITFNFGADAGNASVAFGSTSGITVSTGGDEAINLKWTMDGANLVGYVDLDNDGRRDTGERAITLSLQLGQNGVVTVTADLDKALLHQDVPNASSLTITGITVVGTDGDRPHGDTAIANVTVNVADDVPEVSFSTPTTTVAEGGTVNGTWSYDAGADGLKSFAVTIGDEVKTLNVGTSADFAAGRFTLNANGTWSLATANVGDDTFRTVTLTVTDKDGDTASQSDSFTVIDTTPTVDRDSAANPLGLGVAEVGLTSVADTSETKSGVLQFSFGADASGATVAFGDPAGIALSGQDENLHLQWAVVAGKLIGYVDAGSDGYTVGEEAVTLSLAYDANTQKATVTATLNAAVLHQDAPNASSLTISGVTVVGTDRDGDPATAHVTVTVADDAPEIRATIADAIAGTPSVVDVLQGGTITGALSLDHISADGQSLAVKIGSGDPIALAQTGTSGVYSAATGLGTLTYYTAAAEGHEAGTWTLAVAGTTVPATGYGLTFIATDADGDVSTDSVTFAVVASNLPPVADAGVLNTTQGADPIQVPLHGADSDGTVDHYQIVGLPTGASGSFYYTTTDGGTHTAVTAGSTVPAGAKLWFEPSDSYDTTHQNGGDPLSLTYKAVDDDGASSNTAAVSITIADVGPTAVAETATAAEGVSAAASYNLLLTLDLSTSMRDAVGNTTRLAIMADAVKTLLQSYIDGGAEGHVLLTTFNDTASSKGWFTLQGALTWINNASNLTTANYTDYDDALAKVADGYNAAKTGGTLPSADYTISYFLSDGVPQGSDGQNDNAVSATEEAAWRAFLSANGITSYAIGIGSGADPDYTNTSNGGSKGLQAVASDAAHLIVSTEGNLSATLEQTTHVLPVLGNVLTNDTANLDGWPAHGDAIVNVSVESLHYAVAGAIPNVLSTSPILASTQVVNGATVYTFAVVDDHGVNYGTLVLNAGIGAYTFTPSGANVNDAQLVVSYTVKDADGSTSGPVHLTIDIVDNGEVTGGALTAATSGYDALQGENAAFVGYVPYSVPGSTAPHAFTLASFGTDPDYYENGGVAVNSSGTFTTTAATTITADIKVEGYTSGGRYGTDDVVKVYLEVQNSNGSWSKVSATEVGYASNGNRNDVSFSVPSSGTYRLTAYGDDNNLSLSGDLRITVRDIKGTYYTYSSPSIGFTGQTLAVPGMQWAAAAAITGVVALDSYIHGAEATTIGVEHGGVAGEVTDGVVTVEGVYGTLTFYTEGANAGHYTYDPADTLTTGGTDSFSIVLNQTDGDHAVVSLDIAVAASKFADGSSYALQQADASAAGSATGVHLFADDSGRTLTGSSHDDYLQGGAGSDHLIGGAGNDHLVGGAGNDLLEGGTGNDVLEGQAGNDVLIGGEGNDLLKGGAGADTFKFTSVADGHDTIADFHLGTGADADKIDLDSLFDALGASVPGDAAGRNALVAVTPGTGSDADKYVVSITSHPEFTVTVQVDNAGSLSHDDIAAQIKAQVDTHG